ncbi:MAG: glycosyltransferase [Terrimicrobiaceae bacterium]
MRVVHIGHVPLTPDHPDAGRMVLHPGRWALNLAIAQKTFAGIDPVFVTQVPGGTRNFTTEIEGIPVHYVAGPNRFRAACLFLKDSLRISRYVRGLAPDLVHAHGTEDAYALAAEACGRPCLITAQGCYFIINRGFPPPPVSRARAIQFAEWIALRRAKDVVAKSAYVRDELRAAFPKLRLHEIPNTIDASILSIPADRPKRMGHIAFVGTIVERKGVHLLAEALEILCQENRIRRNAGGAFWPSDLTLHVFGDRPGRESAYEVEQTKRLRSTLGKRVVLHGTVPAIQVAEELSTIPLLVAPSIEEMFGNQLVEALIVGAEPIVTEGTAMAENVRKIGRGRIVPQGDARALAFAIRQALTEGNGHALQARSAALDVFGPEVIALRHREVYEQIRNRS